MTIKKRLVISNVLMIAVPVIITAAIAIACLAGIWITLIHGTGIGFSNGEGFYFASQGILDFAENVIQDAKTEKKLDRLESLSRMLDQNAMALTVVTQEGKIFSYGEGSSQDATLLEAMETIGGEGIVSGDGRELNAQISIINGIQYKIYLFGSPIKLTYGTLKVVATTAAVVLLFGVFLSIFITNRFLTKFVFKKIEEPLQIFSDGVRQIRDGNLEHCIRYDRQDEFAPICSDFNEMAVRLKQSVALTQQYEKSRKELLAGISHDLRSPLTTIRAYAEGLQDGVAKTPQAQNAYLEIIKRKTDDMNRMVAQLVMFSKMELDDYPDHSEILQLDDEVLQLVRALGTEYAEKGLDISIEETVPALVSADPEQLRRVLVNIMENSVKYKEKARGKLQISLKEAADGYMLSLSDDGPGGTAESLPRLFEVFYRGDPARKNPHQGSGLGLAIAANAIRRMKGKISAREAEPAGLCIEIWLPRAEV